MEYETFTTSTITKKDLKNVKQIDVIPQNSGKIELEIYNLREVPIVYRNKVYGLDNAWIGRLTKNKGCKSEFFIVADDDDELVKVLNKLISDGIKVENPAEVCFIKYDGRLKESLIDDINESNAKYPFIYHTYNGYNAHKKSSRKATPKTKFVCPEKMF